MTPAEFANLYPKRPFALRYVERGLPQDRRMVWHIQYTSDYFTSDSDRGVFDHVAPNVPSGCGTSPEEAIDNLLELTAEYLHNIAKACGNNHRDAKERLESFLKIAPTSLKKGEFR